MIPLCRARGMGIIPWSPLARGRLAGRRPEPTSRAQTDEYANKLYDATSDSDQKVVDAVGSVAQQCGVAPAQIALSWLLQKPWITAPIVGASKPQHLKDAVAALDIQLAPGQIQAIETPYIPHPIAGHE
ncbi:L-glyceraldehyde 3-phosphate reductase [bioreactor metagenome]|uniref:L-glyceraldehyde 3-phosphate reductase n=1 Tax=bioreactor metagenome TaxID=1076179 RepID=A0A645GJG8_9ZZZZ